MTINDEILAIANQIANQGRKPTVALVKSKLKQAVPLPTIISVLKTWEHDPNYIPSKLTQAEQRETEETTNPELSIIVENAIAPLRAEIAELKGLIQSLIDKK